MRQTQKTHKVGTRLERMVAEDEEDAYTIASSQKWLSRMQKKEAREAAEHAKEMAKITLPKLKWMGQ